VWRFLWTAVVALSVTLVPPASGAEASGARPPLSWRTAWVHRIGAPCRPAPEGGVRRIEVTTVVFVRLVSVEQGDLAARRNRVEVGDLVQLDLVVERAEPEDEHQEAADTG
jgi:hypothetical protein